MKKIFTLAAAVLASLSLWATDYVLLDSIDFTNTTNFPAVTYTGESATVHGVFFRAKSSKNVKVNNTTPGVDFDGTNISSSGDHGIAIPVTGVNGSLKVIVYHDYNNTSANHKVGISHATGNDPSVSQTWDQSPSNSGTKNKNEFILTKSSLTGTDYIVWVGESSSSYKVIKRVAIYTEAPSCTDPEFTVPEGGTGFVGDPIDLAITSKNNSKPVNYAVTVDGVAGVYGTDYTFNVSPGLVQATPLKAGTFEITFSQASDGTYCDAEESATFEISEKTPVASVTIDGPAAGFIGQELTYTATAEGASDYAWTVNGVDANTNAAEFTFTPAAAGEYSIVCSARNEFNAEDTWIASDAKAVTVTKLCGELIKVSATAYNAATATGIFSGTTSASMSSKDSEKSVYEDLTGYKLNTKNTHLGITFNAGQTLQAGDVVTVFVTTVSAKLQLFADKGTTLIGETDNVVQGENQIILGSAANGANGIYVYRTEAAGADMNPFVAYVSVTRPCEESDNNNASVTINGEAAEKSGTVFNYTLSASYAESTVAVEITLEHPLATLMEDHAASFTMPTPEVGTPSVETFKVKAENGEQAWYSIFVNKAASLNNDATLKALSVEGFELTPAFDPAVVAYSITKAYEAELPATTTVTAETNDANATFNVAYNELVENEILVQVLAEDGETAKTYSIKVYSAEAIKSLSRVLFSNGFDAFIDNTNRTVKAFYLQGEEAPTATITAGANCTAGEIADGKIVVTGADESLAEYVVTLEAVAANTDVVEETAEAGAFDGTEAWVKAGLYLGNTAGFNAGKYVLRRQLKNSDKADDQRVIAGWVRAYFFVGNASKLELANTANKKVKYAIDGGEYTESEAEQLVIELEAGNHMIEIVTNQSSGDCNLSAPKLVKRTATGIENAEAEMKAVKIIRDGQVLILRDGKFYNALGAEVK